MKDILNLHKAITDLPTYQAPDSVWPQIEQTLETQEAHPFPDAVSLDSHIAQVKANLHALEQKQQTTLKKAISQLPSYPAEADVFDQIVKEAEKKHGKNRRLWYWASGIAASILLLIALTLINKPTDDTAQVTITYSQEMMQPLDWQQTNEKGNDADQVLEFIREHCLQIAQKCEEPQFKGLYEEYMQLQEAKLELESQVQLHQHQPDLVRYLIRIEKQQTEIGKQLIQQLIG